MARILYAFMAVSVDVLTHWRYGKIVTTSI